MSIDNSAKMLEHMARRGDDIRSSILVNSEGMEVSNVDIVLFLPDNGESFELDDAKFYFSMDIREEGLSMSIVVKNEWCDGLYLKVDVDKVRDGESASEIKKALEYAKKESA